jgi:hypothetical protein
MTHSEAREFDADPRLCTSVSDTNAALEYSAFAGEVWKPLRRVAAFFGMLYVHQERA